jgi:hypothetical protein
MPFEPLIRAAEREADAARAGERFLNIIAKVSNRDVRFHAMQYVRCSDRSF